VSRWLILVGLALVLFTSHSQAQVGPHRAKIKKIDPERRILRLAVDGKQEDLPLAEDSRVLGALGKSLWERLKGIKEGDEVFFEATKQDGQSLVVVLTPAAGPYGATLAPTMPAGAVVVPAAEGALAKAIASHGTDTVF
jgi:Cu/Ag efflux protein CusF